MSLLTLDEQNILPVDREVYLTSEWRKNPMWFMCNEMEKEISTLSTQTLKHMMRCQGSGCSLALFFRV